MLIPVNNVNKLFQTHENHIQDENNIFLNPNVEDFTVSPETLGNALADIWINLAKKHEKNQLNAEVCQTVFNNIHSVIPKIEKMGDEKKLIHQFFISKIASFSEKERNCLILFFKETINYDLAIHLPGHKKYYFFYAFMKLFNTLNSVNEWNEEIKSYEQLIMDKIINELEDYPDNAKISNALPKMPKEVREVIFEDCKRTTEICKLFKINEIWERSGDAIKDINLCKYENKKYENKIMFLHQITRGKTSIFDSLNLKDEALDNYIKDKIIDYINKKGELPFLWYETFWGFDKDCFYKEVLALHWLGYDRAQQIKKFNFDISNDKISLSDLSFICPNLEELGLSLSTLLSDKHLKDFEDICLFSNLKKVKVNLSSLDLLSLFLTKLSTLKLPENFELELDLSNILGYSMDAWSRKKCIKVFEILPNIENLTKLTITTRHRYDKLSRCLIDEVYKIIFPKFVNVNELNITDNVNTIKKIAKLQKLEKLNFSHNKFKQEKVEKVIHGIKGLTQITHLSLSNCDHMRIKSITSPNLKYFHLNDNEIPVSKSSTAETVIEKVKDEVVEGLSQSRL